MSLAATRVQNLVVKSGFDKNEIRKSRYGCLDLFMTQGKDPNGIITPELRERVRTSIGVPKIEVPAINYNGDISIGSTRSLTIADSENTSVKLEVQFSTYAWGFTMVPSLYLNNEIGYERDFYNKMMGYEYAFLAKLESACLASLATNKTQVVKNPLLYNFSTQQINATFNQGQHLMGSLDKMMNSNDYFGQIDVVGDVGVMDMYSLAAQHGANNDRNLGNEFGGKTLYPTNGIATTPGKYAQGYAVEKGSVGMLFRFERECLYRRRMADGHEWDIITLPGTEIPCGTYNYQSAGDFSAIAGAASADMDRVMKEHFGFAVDVATVTAYTSDPTHRPTPILAFNVSSENAAYGDPVVIAGKVATQAGA